MLLKVVALAGDVGGDLHPVGEPDARDLAQRRVRLLRRGRVDARADPAALRRRDLALAAAPGLEAGSGDLLLRGLAALAHELRGSRHAAADGSNEDARVMKAGTEAEPVFISRGDGVFEPTGHARGPWDEGAQHGGAPSALVVRAVDRLATGLAVSRLTIDFLGAVPLAPLTVRASVVRPGRRFAVAEAVVSADGRDCCFARAVLVRREAVELPEHWEPEPAAPLPAPEAGERSAFPVEESGPPTRDLDGFHRTAFDIRFVGGDYGRGPADVWFRLRRPLVDAEPATPLETLAAAADFGNGVSHVVDFERFLFVNLDLSIQVEREPRGEWVGLAARTSLGEEGTGVARSILYDRDGAVGNAAQTLFVAPR